MDLGINSDSKYREIDGQINKHKRNTYIVILYILL